MIFVNIPGGSLAYSVLGLVIFAGLTMSDFQRLRRSKDIDSAPLMAASIFLDALNVFQFFLRIFSRNLTADYAGNVRHAARTRPPGRPRRGRHGPDRVRQFAAPGDSGVVRVVAGENFWGNIAAQIGGRHVRVTSILTSPTADPHLYESDVANAVAVAEAGLVIENGAGYDDFLSQLLAPPATRAASSSRSRRSWALPARM